jgi:alpha-ribazole phosphatase
MTHQSQQPGNNAERGLLGTSEGDSPISVGRKSGQSPAKRLLLLRHAQIDRSHAGQLIGATDVPRDPAAEATLRTSADRVLRWTPQACCCSPMLRCRQTAAAVAPNLPLHVDPDLREIDFGRWETRVFADVVAHDAALLDRWAAFDPDFAFPGGERVGDFLQRVRAAAERLAHSEAETVLVVAHGGVIRTMICLLLGLEPKHYVAFHVPYATLTVVDLFDGKGVLELLEPPTPTEAPHG